MRIPKAYQPPPKEYQYLPKHLNPFPKYLNLNKEKTLSIILTGSLDALGGLINNSSKIPNLIEPNEIFNYSIST